MPTFAIDFSRKWSELSDDFSICVRQPDEAECLIGVPMREWMLMLTPVMAFLDLMLHPGHLQIISNWVGRLIQ